MMGKTKRFFEIFDREINLDDVVRDARGIEDMIIDNLQGDATAHRVKQLKLKLHPFARWSDLSDWDRVLLVRQRPMYTSTSKIDGSFRDEPSKEEEVNQKARVSAQQTVEGAIGVACTTRDLLNYSIKVFGHDHAVSFGEQLTMADAHPSIAMLTGLYVKTLEDLKRVLEYVESNLLEAQSAVLQRGNEQLEWEFIAFHAGSLLMVAMEAAELIKISCFGFHSAGRVAMEELGNFPLANMKGGIGSLDRESPTLLFAGDDFLPVWSAVRFLEKEGLKDSIQLCGVGPAGDDAARFHENMIVLNSMGRLEKVVRSGIADVLVMSESCCGADGLLEACARVETRVICTSYRLTLGLEDMTDRTDEEIIEELSGKTRGALILDVEKGGRVAGLLAKKIKGERKSSYLLDEDHIKGEAGKCTGCDLCFNVCPTNILLGGAIQGAARGDGSELADLYDDCIFCGDCEKVCPEKIQIRDLINSVASEKIAADRFVFRPGRGPIIEPEARSQAFSLVFGNTPGMVCLIGCGDNGSEKELGDMMRELASRNFLCFTAGCAANNIARSYNEKLDKFILQEYRSAAAARSIVNCGSCTAISQVMGQFLKLPRLGAGISTYANYEECSDYIYNRLPGVIIMWGVKPGRCLAIASGFARVGVPVIVGPTYGFQFPRYLLGDADDLDRWWIYDGFDGRKRDIEPTPEHLIIPCESKEEALAMASKLLFRTLDLRDSRLCHVETYRDLYRSSFGALPEDWAIYIRSEHELPMMQKVKLLKVLREEYGWETDSLTVIKAKDRKGNLLPVDEFNRRYGIEIGRYATHLERLIMCKEKTES